MGRKGKNLFSQSALLNTHTFQYYVNRLTELAISMFDYKNLPDTVDSSYIELALFENACAVYFNDEVVGDLCLDCITSGNFDVYGNPVRRRAYSRYNHYQKQLTQKDSVIIWNNLMRTNSIVTVYMFALRLYNLDRIIDVNTNAQKTPVLIQGTEQQRLTLMNLYKEYNGNQPFIFGDKNLDLNSISALKTDAPYISDKIYELKSNIWNEALTVLGISNVNTHKKERMITDEVTRTQGGTIASRYSRLEARQTAIDKINKMFGTDIEVNYREDFEQDTNGNDTEEGEPDYE